MTSSATVLSALSLQAILDHVVDGVPSPRTNLIASGKKVSKEAIQAVAKALPDLTSASLDESATRVALYHQMSLKGLYKSLEGAPHASQSEVKAAEKAGTVQKGWVSLPDGTALALFTEGWEYRKGGVRPAHCAKQGGDAMALVFRNTRRMAAIFRAALDTADKARASTQEKAAQRATKAAEKPKPAKEQAKKPAPAPVKVPRKLPTAVAKG